MQKILVTVGALVAIGYLAYRAMYKAHDSAVADEKVADARREADTSPAAPTQQLQNVRDKAKSIEANDRAYADKVEAETKAP